MRRAAWGQFAGVPHDRLVERVAEAAAIVGRPVRPDPLAVSWDAMPDRERAFWLAASKQPKDYARKDWDKLPGDVACVLRANLWRAARRAAEILGAGDTVTA